MVLTRDSSNTLNSTTTIRLDNSCLVGGTSIGNILPNHDVPNLNVKDPSQMNLFEFTNLEEIEKKFNWLSVSYGKWNAELYLSIQKRLYLEKVPTVDASSQVLQEIKNPEFNSTHIRSSGNNKQLGYSKITVDCAPSVVTEQIEAEKDIEICCPRQPTYRQIFNNARQRKNTPKPPRIVGHSSTFRNVEFVIPPPTLSTESTTNPREVQIKKNCTLHSNAINNHLVEIRQNKAMSKQKCSQGNVSSNLDVVVDTIGTLFDEKPMTEVLETYVDGELDVIKSKLGEKVTAMENEYEELDIYYLKSLFPGESEKFEQVDTALTDTRWRKKFELNKIEISEEEDSNDYSDIYDSDSSTSCSIDSTSNGNIQKLSASRIPFLGKVQERSEKMFTKIDLKWDKVVKKNLKESNVFYTPHFHCLYNNIRVRRNNQLYNKVLASLESGRKVYSKTFMPYRHRLKAKHEKMKDLIEAINKKVQRSRTINHINIRSAPEHKIRSMNYTPTKFTDKNHRQRLECMINHTEMKEECFDNWNKRDIADDFVNLRPIISTRKRKMIPAPKTLPKKNLQPALVSFRNYPSHLVRMSIAEFND